MSRMARIFLTFPYRSRAVRDAYTAPQRFEIRYDWHYGGTNETEATIRLITKPLN